MCVDFEMNCMDSALEFAGTPELPGVGRLDCAANSRFAVSVGSNTQASLDALGLFIALLLRNSGLALLCSPQPPMAALKHRKPCVITANAQHPSTRMANQACRFEHHLLNDGSDVPALGLVTQWGVRSVQCVLPNKKQEVQCYAGQLAHQEGGVELTQGQRRQIHIGLELRVELFVRCVLGAQRNDGLYIKALWQRGGPALQDVFGQQHGVAELFHGSLGQTVYAPGNMSWTAHALDIERLFPQAFALIDALWVPHRTGVCHLVLSQCFQRGCARVPFDEQVNLAFQNLALLPGRAHQFRRTKAQVRTHQQSRGGQGSRHGQNELKVVFTLDGRMLQARAQGQFQAIALCCKVHCQRAVAINAGVGGAHQLLGSVFVVHDEGIQINRGVATVQHSEVDVLATHARAQEPIIDGINQLEPVTGTRIPALAQCRSRRHAAKTQSVPCKFVATKRLNRFIVVLALAQKPKVGLEDVAVGDATEHRDLGVHQRVDVDAFELLANERQTGVCAQVVGQLFNNEFCHGRAHLECETHVTGMSLISIGKSTISRTEFTDLDN